MGRKNTIKKMRNNGWTLQKIGNVFGISRQRVYQILNPQIKKYYNFKFYCNSFLFQMLESKRSINDIENIGNQNKELRYFTGRNFLAELIRTRDEHTCQLCSKKWEKGKRRFDVHHISPQNECDRTYKNYKKFDDMITLCHKCHLNLNHIRKKMRVKSKKLLTG